MGDCSPTRKRKAMSTRRPARSRKSLTDIPDEVLPTAGQVVEHETETSYSMGMKLSVCDKNGHWLPGQIVDIRPDEVLIHFLGWSFQWDEWIAMGSDRLAEAKLDLTDDAVDPTSQPTCCIMKFSTTSQLKVGPKTWNQAIQTPILSQAAANEIAHREADIRTLQNDIDALTLRAQEGGDDADEVGLELAKVLGVKGKHLKSIAALRVQQKFVVTGSETFTAQKPGIYRIVVRVNGTTSQANVDGLSILVNGTPVARAIAGLQTGHQIGVHLHELVPLRATDSFQIYQAFNGHNLAKPIDNSLFVESVNHPVCRYTTTASQVGSVVKTWTNVQHEEKAVVTLTNSTQFVATQAGLYRVVVKVSGASAAANSDHIALQVGGTTIHRAMVGLNTGHQITAHLHELVSLTAGQSFQIFQSFNGGNLTGIVDNTLFVERTNPKACRFTANVVQSTGYKTWQVVSEDKGWITLSSNGHTFIADQPGQYRVVVKINGASSGANADHIALHLNGTSIAQSMVGLNTGCQIASHIHEIVTLKHGDRLQVYQQFNSNNLAGAIDNTLFFERLDALEVIEEKEHERAPVDDGSQKTLQQQLQARAIPSCQRCLRPFTGAEPAVPNALRCGHIFCLKCAQNGHTLAGISCPACNLLHKENPCVESQIVSVAKTASDCAQRLLLAEGDSKEASKNTLPTCDECKKAFAAVRFEKLGVFLCAKCQATYSKLETVKMHGMINIEDWTPSATCSVHDRPAELFCYEDQVLICFKCVASNHKGHFAEEPTIAFASVIAPNLEALKLNAASQKAEILSLIRKMGEAREQLLSSATVFPLVRNSFQDAHKSLDRYEQRVKCSIEDHINRVQVDLCDSQLSLLKCFSSLSKMCDQMATFAEAKGLPSTENATTFLSILEQCQTYKCCNFPSSLKVEWQPEHFEPPAHQVQMPTLKWETNARRLLDLEPCVLLCRSVTQQGSGGKFWSQHIIVKKSVEFKDSICTVKKSGLYRVVARVNGASSGANSDHLALHVNGTSVGRAMVGLHTGHQIAVHLHEVVNLRDGESFQIYQQFNGNNLIQPSDNLLFVETIEHRIARYSATAQQAEGAKSWNVVIQEDPSMCVCTNQNSFTVKQTGLYRVVVKINGTSSGANSDCIAIVAAGHRIHTAMVGLNTGHQIVAHLHEMIALRAGESFQIYQAFNSHNLALPIDNSLVIEPANPKICRYTSTVAMASGSKPWQVIAEEKTWVIMSADGKTFTVNQAGLYRIVIMINGASSGANSDHIALHVDGAVVARALVGLGTGHQIASHLHELVQLKQGQIFQVYQQFNGNSLADASFNSLYVEKL